MKSLRLAAIALTLTSLFVAPAQARPHPHKVVLLTSLDTLAFADSLPWWAEIVAPLYRAFLPKIEKQFRDHFKDLGYPYTVEVYHYADQALLWHKLHDSEYVAVYWLSHGGDIQAGDKPAGIVDADHFDVTPVFKEAHPWLKTLALIGCSNVNSGSYISRFARTDNPELQIIAEPATVNAVDALRDALWQSAGILNPEPSQVDPRKELEDFPRLAGYSVDLERKCGTQGNSPSVRIETRDRIIAVFPPCFETGELQTAHGYIPAPSEGTFESPGELKLRANTGISMSDKFFKVEIGEITMRHLSKRFPGKWKVFLDPETQKPFGVTDHIYKFSGELPERGYLDTFSPFY